MKYHTKRHLMLNNNNTKVMHYSQKVTKIAKFMLLFFTLGLSAQAIAENLSLVSYYGKTGGIVGDLNTSGQFINGKAVCATDNTNANGVPGCDASDDPGYQKNDINDPTDDTYNGDLIVRTNDQFEVFAGWSVTGGNEPVTITAVLPSAALRWDSLPASCKVGSSISADGLTLVCVRSNYTAASAYSLHLLLIM